jgi:hypothetical protein
MAKQATLRDLLAALGGGEQRRTKFEDLPIIEQVDSEGVNYMLRKADDGTILFSGAGRLTNPVTGKVEGVWMRSTPLHKFKHAEHALSVLLSRVEAKVKASS